MKNLLSVGLLTITIIVTAGIGIKVIRIENTKVVTEIVDKKIDLAKSRFQENPVTATILITCFLGSVGIWIFAIKMHRRFTDEVGDLKAENREQKVTISYLQRQVKELVGMLLEYEKLLHMRQPKEVEQTQTQPLIPQAPVETLHPASKSAAKKATQKVAVAV